MPTVIKHEQQLTSTRTLTLPDIFNIEVCLSSSDPTLEKGGADSSLSASNEITNGGADNSLQPFAEIQNAN